MKLIVNQFHGEVDNSTSMNQGRPPLFHFSIQSYLNTLFCCPSVLTFVGNFSPKKRGKTAYQLLLLGSVEVGVFALVMTFLWYHGLAEIVSLDVCHIFTL